MLGIKVLKTYDAIHILKNSISKSHSNILIQKIEYADFKRAYKSMRV